MKKMKEFVEYSYWCCAHINYKHFGEDGETGKIILSFIAFFGLFDIFAFFRVLYYDHTPFEILFGQNFKDVYKAMGVLVGILINYYVSKYFKNYPILNNIKYKYITKKKRILHTIFVFFILAFELYVLLVILSPTFHPRQIIGL